MPPSSPTWDDRVPPPDDAPPSAPSGSPDCWGDPDECDPGKIVCKRCEFYRSCYDTANIAASSILDRVENRGTSTARAVSTTPAAPKSDRPFCFGDSVSYSAYARTCLACPHREACVAEIRRDPDMAGSSVALPNPSHYLVTAPTTPPPPPTTYPSGYTRSAPTPPPPAGGSGTGSATAFLARPSLAPVASSWGEPSLVVSDPSKSHAPVPAHAPGVGPHTTHPQAPAPNPAPTPPSYGGPAYQQAWSTPQSYAGYQPPPAWGPPVPVLPSQGAPYHGFSPQVHPEYVGPAPILARPQVVGRAGTYGWEGEDRGRSSDLGLSYQNSSWGGFFNTLARNAAVGAAGAVLDQARYAAAAIPAIPYGNPFDKRR